MLPRGSRQRGPKEHPEPQGMMFALVHYLRSIQRKLSGKRQPRPFQWERTESTEPTSSPEAEALKAKGSLVAKSGKEQNNYLRVWVWIEGFVWFVCFWFGFVFVFSVFYGCKDFIMFVE